MSLKNIPRAAIVSWPVVVGVLVLASCGSDATSAATASTINLDTEATNYIVKDPVTTTIAPVISVDDASGPQVYVVQAGDYAIKVANLFQVPLEDLITYNGWASGAEFPFPGEEVLIPPGGVAVVADPTDPAAATAPVGETIPEAGDNCPAGKHTVVAGDYPLALSKLYDVTIESLDAANAGNPAYGQFVPGQEIIIPAKANC
jgi:LysM repeat protein